MLVNSDLLSQLAPLDLKARQIVEGFITGLHKSPYYGFSVEFAEHRPYNPGDELKHIDWKVYGKSERFYVKRYEEETNLRCYLMMDVSSSMDFKYFADWSKLRYAVHFGAALLFLMYRQRDACGYIPFAEEIEAFRPAKSSYSHLQMMFGQLEQLINAERKEKKKTSSAQAIHEVAERLNHRSLVIILSDLFETQDDPEQLISSLKHLRHRNHEVILFNVVEKKSERELAFGDNRIVFEDMESGGNIEVLPSQIREDYRQQIQEYTNKFKIACSEFNIDYEEVDTQTSFDIALLAYLNKRKRLG